MTIAELRKKFPGAEFHFFDADGYQLPMTPFLHDKVHKWERRVYQFSEFGESWETEHLFIRMAG